jgi:hypothetical protein
MMTQQIIITNFIPLNILSFCTSLDLLGFITIFISVVALSLPLILFSFPNGFMRVFRNGQWILVPILTGTAAGASNAIISNALGGNNRGGNTGGNNQGGNNQGGNNQGGNNQGGNNQGGNTGGNNQGGTKG